ncbi:MAG: hypothetical protein C6H99_00440 [Epsilonproteobacteria bacterium]|nr:hypothetical protein [Campylobacterota bacterium]NPA63401.1 hypothetical protein [Campylobacterota bacterium]
MPHHKHHEKLEKIKEAIQNNPDLSEEEKSQAMKLIEEWYIEDQADQYFWTMVKEKLLEISAKIEPILAELGFL